MQPIAKSVRQVRSTESSHIVNTTIRLSHNAVSVTIGADITSGLVRGPFFCFMVKLSHSLFYLILKQHWMRLSRDVSSNQDRMTPACPLSRRLSHQMPCSLSPGLAGQWTGVDIIKSETKLLCPD